MSGSLGILGLIGNIGGGGLEQYGASVQSHKNRRFMREQRATAYQTAVADMRAAGLNPNAIFGAGGGTPAAPVSGDYANPFAGAGGLGDEVTKAYSAGDVAASLSAQADINRATARAVESDTDLKLAENSAYRAALNTDAGRIGAVKARYGSLGGAGEVMGALGVGNVLGGDNSAKGRQRVEEEVKEINQALEEGMEGWYGESKRQKLDKLRDAGIITGEEFRKRMRNPYTVKPEYRKE